MPSYLRDKTIVNFEAFVVNFSFLLVKLDHSLASCWSGCQTGCSFLCHGTVSRVGLEWGSTLPKTEPCSAWSPSCQVCYFSISLIKFEKFLATMISNLCNILQDNLIHSSSSYFDIIGDGNVGTWQMKGSWHPTSMSSMVLKSVSPISVPLFPLNYMCLN